MTWSDRTLGRALLAPVVASIVFSFARLACEVKDVPDDDDYVAAAAFFDNAHLDKDDAIAVLPPWSVRPLQFFGSDSDNVIASDGPWSQLALGRYRRLFVVVEPDGEAWNGPLAALAPAASPTHFGALAVVEYPGGGGPARFDARARFGAARVDVDGAARVEVDGAPCVEPVRNRVGVHCAGRPDWQRVVREWAQVTENGSDVIVVNPAPGADVVVSFDNAFVGDTLVVAAGHTRDAAVTATSPVTLVVKIDGAVVATLSRRPSFVVEPLRQRWRSLFVRPLDPAGEGFRAEVIDTRAFRGAAHTISFVIRSDDADDEAAQKNDFAFDAFSPGGP